MIKVINESNNPYWFVTYDHDGDAKSDYQSTALIQAMNEQAALDIAEKLLPTQVPSARFFGIRDDKRLGKSTSLSQFRKAYPFSNYLVLNESLQDRISKAYYDAISSQESNEEGTIATEGDFEEYTDKADLYSAMEDPVFDIKEPRELDYSDPKYQKVADYLNNNGFPGSKFVGKCGYVIPQYNAHALIVCDDIFKGFYIATSRQNLGLADATEYMAQLTKAIDAVEDINAILADATTDDNKNRHVNESVKYMMEINDPEDSIKNLINCIKSIARGGHSFEVVVDPNNSDYTTKFYIDGDGSDQIIEFKEINESTTTVEYTTTAIDENGVVTESHGEFIATDTICINESSIIEHGSQDFGKPGTYVVYRNGGHQTKRGFISFSDTKAGADKYAQDGRQTEKFVVTINNPYVVQADSSFGAFVKAYKDLVNNAITPRIDPNTEKINDAWRKYDALIAVSLEAKGYDSLIYIVPQNNEVNVLGADIDKMPNINEYNESVPQALGTE